jgi:hypothetical protein
VITVTVTTESNDDLDDAVEEAMEIVTGKIKEGYLSGLDSNDERGYSFETEEKES